MVEGSASRRRREELPQIARIDGSWVSQLASPQQFASRRRIRLAAYPGRYRFADPQIRPGVVRGANYTHAQPVYEPQREGAKAPDDHRYRCDFINHTLSPNTERPGDSSSRPELCTWSLPNTANQSRNKCNNNQSAIKLVYLPLSIYLSLALSWRVRQAC